MDIGKWYLATAEFGQKVDALVTELQRSQAVTPQAAAEIVGCGVSWAALSNNTFQEIMTRIAMLEKQLKEKDESIEKKHRVIRTTIKKKRYIIL